jgi:hypothetical protein
MMVTPLPGTSRNNLRDILRDVMTRLDNLSRSDVDAYLEWVVHAARVLGSQVSSTDIEQLVHTRGYDRLLAFAVGTAPSEVTTEPVDMTRTRAVRRLLQLEIDQRIAAFNLAKEQLDNRIGIWSRAGQFILPDSTFYIKYPEKLEDVNFWELLDAPREPIHIVIPMVIVDELDSLKDRSSKWEVRWRAGYTLSLLHDRTNEGLRGPLAVGKQLSLPGGYYAPGPEVTIEVVPDPPGHRRLAINDDEIVARNVSYEPLAARRIRLLTYDTGQSMRARSAGLDVLKLQLPPEERPIAGKGARARRRAKGADGGRSDGPS